MKKPEQLIRDTWHLSNILHNYIKDYEDLMLDEGIDPHYFKQVIKMLDDLAKEE